MQKDEDTRRHGPPRTPSPATAGAGGGRTAPPHPGHRAEEPAGPRAGPRAEYRAEELAAKAGITVRTLRFYRERRLLPAPRREGRVAWYDDRHLARLRTVAALLERGHTLGGIADLISAFEDGRDVGDVLGLSAPSPFPWSGETPVRLTPEELADHFAGEVTAENLATALGMGYVAVDGEEIVHVSDRLLHASRALVDSGVPLAAVLAAGRELRTHVEALAGIFTALIRTHVLADVLDGVPPGEPPGETETARVTELVERLRPVSRSVVDAELSLAVDRRMRAELDAWLADRRPRRPAGEHLPERQPEQ